MISVLTPAEQNARIPLRLVAELLERHWIRLDLDERPELERELTELVRQWAEVDN